DGIRSLVVRASASNASANPVSVLPSTIRCGDSRGLCARARPDAASGRARAGANRCRLAVAVNGRAPTTGAVAAVAQAGAAGAVQPRKDGRLPRGNVGMASPATNGVGRSLAAGVCSCSDDALAGTSVSIGGGEAVEWEVIEDSRAGSDTSAKLVWTGSACCPWAAVVGRSAVETACSMDGP